MTAPQALQMKGHSRYVAGVYPHDVHINKSVFGLMIVGVSDLAEEVDVEVVLAVVEGKALDVITHSGR